MVMPVSGNEVRSVFETAANGALTLTNWSRRVVALNPKLEQLEVSCVVVATGERLHLTSAPFLNGLINEAAALLGSSSIANVSRGGEMVIDLKIKGLTEAVTNARQGISAVRQAAARVGDSAAAFAATAAEVQKQIDAAHDDLKFEATQLGNAGPPLSDGSEQSGAGDH